MSESIRDKISKLGDPAYTPCVGPDVSHCSDSTMNPILTKWISHVSMRHKEKPNTTKVYKRVAKDLDSHWPDGFERVSKTEIDSLVQKELSRGLKPVSINLKLAVLSSFLTWAHDNQFISSKPDIKLLKAPKSSKSIRVLNSDQINRLVAAVTENYPWIKTAVLIALGTGLRREEIRFLTWRDIDFSKNLIHVKAKDGFSPKSLSERAVPMSASLSTELSAVNKKDGWVIRDDCPTRQMSLSKMEKELKRAMETAGIYVKGQPTWHLLRHTFSSRFVEAGGDIKSLQDILGHADIKTTQLYMHSSLDRQRSIIDQMDKL